jgi:hypothetical protein
LKVKFNSKFVKLVIDSNNETHNGKVVVEIYEDIASAFVKVFSDFPEIFDNFRAFNYFRWNFQHFSLQVPTLLKLS